MRRRILFLDTPEGELSDLSRSFLRAADGGAEVSSVSRLADLVERVTEPPPFDLVIVDWFLGDGKASGAQALAALREADPDLPVVAVAESGDVDTAAQAIRAGASDFLVRTARLADRVETLLGKVKKLVTLRDRARRLAEQNARLREEAAARWRMVGRSEAFVGIVETVRRVARIPRPVLVVGERGTGKELVARAIHAEAGSADRPIVTVNCAAFPDNLLESELFGHERGAFTGADRATSGKFESAKGGTLFLDEIGHMSLPFQQKILRVVEYGVFTRVGGTAELRTDARIIAATNADLERLMREGSFLRDLYDRLSFEVIEVPPLRERPEDIEELAYHFLAGFAREIPAFRGKRLSVEALAALRRYRLPGNARELKNIIERAAYRDATNEITAADLGLPVGTAEPPRTGTFKERIAEYERRLVVEALEAAGDNQAEAARRLGLTYDQFRYHLRKLKGTPRAPRDPG